MDNCQAEGKSWRRAPATAEEKRVSGPRQPAKELLELRQLPASWSDLEHRLNLNRETKCSACRKSLWYRLTIKPHRVSQNLGFSGEQSHRIDGKFMKTQAALCFSCFSWRRQNATQAKYRPSHSGWINNQLEKQPAYRKENTSAISTSYHLISLTAYETR